MAKHPYFSLPRPALAVCLLFSLPLLASAATFAVNTTGDSVDVHPGDGVCLDVLGRCSLRAAVMEADALAGADTIDLTAIDDPNAPIVLTLPGVDESYAATGGDPAWTVAGTPDPAIGDLDLTDSVTILGAGPDKTVVEWPASVKSAPATGDRIFDIQTLGTAISVQISGLTVRNGVTPAAVDVATTPEGLIWKFKRNGAGIAIGGGASMELVDPTIEHGQCGSGGHGGSHGGGEGEDCGGETGISTVLTDVWLLDNQSGGDGGGLYNTAPLTLGNSIISGNSAKSKGGGMYNGAELLMFDTTIGTVPGFPVPNTAKHGGGLFDGAFHQTHIRDSAITGNKATNGGGIAGRRRVLMYLVNTTISGNTAAEAGGGITTNGQAVLENLTIADNTVTAPGEGGIGAGINAFAMGSFTFVNTLLANNTLQGASPQTSNCGCSGDAACSVTVMRSVGHNLADDSSCFLDPAHGDLPQTDPLLQPLADNGGSTPSHSLVMSSPAVDAGSDSQCPNNDQRGGLRPADGDLDGSFGCDIGAYELFTHTADLHIEDVVAPDRVFTGDPVMLSIVVHNDPAATAAASAVAIDTDALPTGFAVSEAAYDAPGGSGSCTLAGGAVSCMVGDLGVGESATVNVLGSISSPGEYPVTARVASAAPLDPLPANNEDHVHVLAIGASDLAVSAGSVGAPVDVGSTATIPFEILNQGPDTASGLRLLVSFSDGLTYTVSSLPGTCAVSVDDGSVLCTLDAVPAGGRVSGSVAVRADKETAAIMSLAVDADQRDVDTGNSSVEVGMTLQGLSDLSLDAGFAPAESSPQVPVPFQFQVYNHGPASADSATVVARLPVGLVYAGSSSACTANGQDVTCTTGPLLADASTLGAFLVQAAQPGNYTVSASVFATKTDPVSGDNSANTTLSVKAGSLPGADASSPGGGGCAYRADGAFDPGLLIVLGLAVAGAWRRQADAVRSRRGRVRSCGLRPWRDRAPDRRDG